MTGRRVHSGRQRGLTLVELLTALTVFAMLSAAGIAFLSGGLQSRDSAASSLALQQRIAVLRAVLRADLSQMVDRQARMASGETQPWRFIGTEAGSQGLPLMAFLRGGWDNPAAQAARGDLVYVEYIYEDNRLIRRMAPRPDRAPETPVLEQALAENILDLRLRYYNGTSWLRDYRVAADRALGLPAAVEMTFTDPAAGRMRLLFLAAGQGI